MAGGRARRLAVAMAAVALLLTTGCADLELPAAALQPADADSGAGRGDGSKRPVSDERRNDDERRGRRGRGVVNPRRGDQGDDAGRGDGGGQDGQGGQQANGETGQQANGETGQQADGEAGQQADGETADPGAVVWADEFDGAAGSRPDPAAWTYRTGGAWGDGELQHYRDSTDNAALDGDGHLVITAREGGAGLSCWYGACDYTSARLDTADKAEHTYGRFEARMRIPRGQGIWPAFWLLGNDLESVGWPVSGEIDIMENIGSRPGEVVGALHGPGHDLTGGHTLSGAGAFADGFHTYAIEWTPDAITWYVDDVQFQRRTRAEVGDGWVYDHPFFVVLNVAVGGGWPGSPDASTTFPQRLVIDHVRILDLGS